MYGSVVLGVFHWCYVGITLVCCSVPLVFRVMFSCSATVPGCSAVPPVFRVPIETNTHELGRVTRNNWCLCKECGKEEREIDCLCRRDVTAISESQYEG